MISCTTMRNFTQRLLNEHCLNTFIFVMIECSILRFLDGLIKGLIKMVKRQCYFKYSLYKVAFKRSIKKFTKRLKYSFSL